jgi:hypothetical protein
MNGPTGQTSPNEQSSPPAGDLTPAGNLMAAGDLPSAEALMPSGLTVPAGLTDPTVPAVPAGLTGPTVPAGSKIPAVPAGRSDQAIRTGKFIQLMRSPIRFRFFLFAKLPSAFFSGLRIAEMDESGCTATVPYKWFSQNPFRSTYFACLGMAAEMSTGALAMAHIYKHDPPVSMLVIKLEASYFKKAVGLTCFLCKDGQAIKATIEKAVATGEGQQFRARSVGFNEAGEEVAEFFITWSFKVKSRR